MKGVKKCFGLSLLFFIMVGLSLSVFSDVNAKKYEIDTLPLYRISTATESPNFYSTNYTFTMSVSNDIDVSSLRSFNVMSATLNPDNNQCQYAGSVKLPTTFYNSSTSQLEIRYGFAGINPNDTQLFERFSNKCLTVGALPSFNNNTFPVGAQYEVLSNQLPYRFPYDSFYRTSSGVLNDDGVTVGTKFDVLTLFGLGPDNSDNVPSTIYSLTVPFGSPKDVSSFYPSMPIEFSGEFVIDPEDPVNFPGFSSGTTLTLDYSDLGYGSTHHNTFNCNTNIGRDDPSDPSSVYFIKYSCPASISSEYNSNARPYFKLIIDFDYNSSSDTKFNMLIFDSSVSITDDDTSPGGSWGFNVSGSNVNSAPGSIYSTDVTHTESNFLASLVNLFSFNLINPFAPIFDLFNNNDSCANIPILAGMLHSESSTVCPWFDSTTRNIVTPVLGLSAMMLVFGFTVRWLGSRSGNFVEDSGGVDSGGLHFENKYRRKN